MYTHYLVKYNVTRDRIVTKYTVISHSFQQKLTQDLRKNYYLPEIKCGGRHFIYFIKLTLPILNTQHYRLFIDGVTQTTPSCTCSAAMVLLPSDSVLERMMNISNIHSNVINT